MMRILSDIIEGHKILYRESKARWGGAMLLLIMSLATCALPLTAN